jgi:hypothetical protein
LRRSFLRSSVSISILVALQSLGACDIASAQDLSTEQQRPSTNQPATGPTTELPPVVVRAPPPRPVVRRAPSRTTQQNARSAQTSPRQPLSEGSAAAEQKAASELTVTRREIAARPITRPAEVLEAAPGLIITQHSGEGKANQYFLRGYNLDHGTDLAITVDGMPILI